MLGPSSCAVCQGSFTPREPYVRGKSACLHEQAHVACSDLAVFLAEWLFDDSITYGEAWRLWRTLEQHTDNKSALAKGMRLAASIEQRLSVFGESLPDVP